MASFDHLMKLVAMRPEIKLKTERRSGYESLMYQGFIYLDIISLVVIIAHLKSIQGKAGSGMGMSMPMKAKKF